MIKWIFKDKELHLISDIRPPIKPEVIIVFDKTGTVQTDKECRSLELQFIQKSGGPLARSQWGVSGRAHQQLWEAAHAVWGYGRKK